MNKNKNDLFHDFDRVRKSKALIWVRTRCTIYSSSSIIVSNNNSMASLKWKIYIERVIFVFIR